MKQYLGGTVIPYVELGKKKDLSSNYVNSFTKTGTYYEIAGGVFDKPKFETFDSIYRNAGYDVSLSPDENKITATKSSLNLTVVISEDVPEAVEDDEESTFLLKAYYDEPFDNTKAGAYTTDELDTIHTAFDNHDIPYIYLGTINPYIYVASSSKNAIRVYGWNYDDSLITSINSTLSNDGWTVIVDGDSLTASKIADDKCNLSASFSKPASSSNRTYIEYTYEEGYYPEGVTSFTDDQLTLMHDNMDNHEIPFIYLGTKNPKFDYSTDKNVLTITGNDYDERIIQNAKTTLENNSFTVSEYVNSNKKTALRFSKEFDDGCTMLGTLDQPYISSKDGKGSLYLTVNYGESVKVNVDQTAWDSTIQAMIDEYFNGHTIPFINCYDKKVSSSFSEDKSTLTLTPQTIGGYNPKFYQNALNVLTESGYNVNLTNKNYSGLYGITATRTETDGDKFTIKISALDSISSYSTNPSISIFYEEAYNSEDATSWSDGVSRDEGVDVLTSMNSHFDNHTVPFAYLGAQRFTSKWDSKKSTMTIYGGTWNEAILTNVKAAIANDSDTTGTYSEPVETTSSTSKKTYTITKTFTDTSSIKITLTQPSNATNDNPYPRTTLDLFYKDAYGASSTDWDDTTKAAIKKIMGDNTIPYIYLHTDTPKATAKSTTPSSSSTTSTSDLKYKNVKIEGGTWDERIYSEGKNALLDAGYTIYDDSYIRNNTKSIDAYKFNEDESVTRIMLYKDGTSETAKAILIAMYDEKEETPTGSWTSDDETTMKQYLKDTTIPYLYPGAKYTIKHYDTTSSTLGYLQIETDTSKNSDNKYEYYYANFYYFWTYKEKLTADGWDVDFVVTNHLKTAPDNSNNSMSIDATKDLDDGSLLKMNIKYGSNKLTIKINTYDKFEIPDDGAYTADTLTKINNCLYNQSIPYIYLGAKTEIAKSSSSNDHYVILIGERWDDSIYSNAEEVLKNDSKQWSTFYSYASNGNKNGKILYAYSEFVVDDVTYHMSINIYKQASDSRPILEVGCYL